MKKLQKTVGDNLYVAALLPFDQHMKSTRPRIGGSCSISSRTKNSFVRAGGLCINPEAGEIFYLTRQEKRRVLEIAMEEAHGKVRSLLAPGR